MNIASVAAPRPHGPTYDTCKACREALGMLMLDPYEGDMNDRDTWVYLCPDCEHETAQSL